MSSDIERYDEAVASLTAPGQPFAFETVELGGISYRNYTQMPANLGAYCQMMQGHGDKTCMVYRDERYSFAEAWAHSVAFGAALVERYRLTKGDRVAILSRNNPQWMMAFIGATAVGAVAVPMNAWWTTEELDYGFADSGATVVVVDREQVTEARRSVFGLRLPRIKLFDRDGEPDIDEIETSVVSIDRNGNGRVVFTVTDGARWVQTDDRTVVGVRPGTQVILKKGALGSFFAKFRGSISVRVQRVN